MTLVADRFLTNTCGVWKSKVDSGCT